ncbi:BrnT family toxin [Chromohalobacter sp. HP20-39]|uniref:BrnT family toxin n=1 Tax=Chromohalobacter sp. HP20-39 TaxID=3079306 RepID=UPI00294AF0BF|nr:BrnT family toxin [Chromohalobacter sp. HP20-39]MDV6320010.1 BrnT family toxin [Chromohalobacter sp. HP20-39]
MQYLPYLSYLTVGKLNERAVVIVWTWRGNKRRIISMRYANDREKRRFKDYLD